MTTDYKERATRQAECEPKFYARVHNWLRVNYGKASRCENPECLRWSQVFDWALKAGEVYRLDRNAFAQLCRSCHIRQDTTDERREKMRLLRLGKPALNRGQDSRPAGICAQCQQPFKSDAYNRKQKYCSTSCLAEARRVWMRGNLNAIGGKKVTTQQ